jgi:hypothetical protein
MRGPRITRDLMMFGLGAGGFVHEVLYQGFERPFVLSACLALMGLPFVLAANGRRNGGK